MKIIYENLWDLHKKGEVICITTNGYIKSNGECVMGRGCASEAKERFPNLPIELGLRIDNTGNKVYFFHKYNIITFPVKYNWYEKANIQLIKTSYNELSRFIDTNRIEKVFLPKPGCGNGQLEWKIVEKELELIQNDGIIIVDFPKKWE